MRNNTRKVINYSHHSTTRKKFKKSQNHTGGTGFFGNQPVQLGEKQEQFKKIIIENYQKLNDIIDVAIVLKHGEIYKIDFLASDALASQPSAETITKEQFKDIIIENYRKLDDKIKNEIDVAIVIKTQHAYTIDFLASEAPAPAQPAPAQPAPAAAAAQPAPTQPTTTATTPPPTTPPPTTQPTPTQPTPTQPATTQPTPAQPTTTTTTPPPTTQPAPTQPTPAQPTTTQPTPAQPAAAAATPPPATQPTPAQPTPTQPAAAQPAPAAPARPQENAPAEAKENVNVEEVNTIIEALKEGNLTEEQQKEQQNKLAEMLFTVKNNKKNNKIN